MALSFISTEGDDSLEDAAPADPGRWQRRGRYAIYGGLIPAMVIVLAGAGWYIGTGETPFALIRRLTTTPSVSMAMPVSPDAKPLVAEQTKPPEKPAETKMAAAPDKAANKPASAMLSPPAPASGAMPAAPTPEAKPAEPASGAMPKAAPGDAPKKEADAKPLEPAPAAEPEAVAPSPSANTSLSPVKPIPLSKAGEAPPPPPAAPATEAAKPAEAPAAGKPAAEKPAEEQQALAAPAPPPPPMNEPQAPPAGETLAPPSFAQLPARTDLKPLPAAPAGDLLKDSPDGPLPVADGTKEARTVYARPFVEPKEKAVKIAVVVTGLGVSREAAEAAIAKLPPEIGLSFSPYAGNLDTWIKKARAAGHEVLLDLPLEPPNFPMHDAGPLAIMAKDSTGNAMDRLRTILGKTTSYVGVSAALHSPVSGGEVWAPILRDVKARGLLFLGDGLAGMKADDVPASATIALVPDETPFRAAIDSSLARLLATAQRDGFAVAYVSPRPVTFERLLAWAVTLPQKGAVLAPASALVQAHN